MTTKPHSKFIAKKIIFGFILIVLISSLNQVHAVSNVDPSQAYTIYLKALLQQSQGNLAAAQQSIEEAIAMSPESGFLYKLDAELAFQLGSLDKAADSVTKALSYDDKNYKLQILAGQIFWAQGKSELAEEKLKKAVSLAPDESEPLVNLAVAMTPKKPEEAIHLYEDFLDRHPDDPEIRERLAQLYQSNNQLDKAKGEWEKVIALMPGDLRAHLAQAQIAEVEQDTATAVAHYEAVLAQDPKNLALLLRIGELRYRSEDLAKAQDLFSRAKEIAPDSPSANFWLAVMSENRGDWDQAISLLKQVVDKTPEPSVMLRLSYYYSQVGNSKEAIKILETLSKNEPENTDFLTYLYISYEKTAQYDKAIETVQKLISIDKDNLETHFHLATLYDKAQKFSLAEKELKSIIDTDPNFHMALNYLGYSYADKGIKLDLAETYLTKAIALDPDNSAYLDSMGWLLYKKGDTKKARDFLLEAVKNVDDPVIYSHIADCYLKEGDSQKAIGYYDDSLRRDPSDKTVEKKLKNLVKGLSQKDRASFYLNRTVKSFLTGRSFRSLVQVKVGEKMASVKSNAQFQFEKGESVKLEVPHTLGSPLLLLLKKKNSPSQFLAIHPSIESQESWISPAFDRIGEALFGQFVDSTTSFDLDHSTPKGDTLIVQSPTVKLTFQEGLGQLLKIEYLSNGTLSGDQLELKYIGEKKSFTPLEEIQWSSKAQDRFFNIKFLKAVLSKKAESKEIDEP